MLHPPTSELVPWIRHRIALDPHRNFIVRNQVQTQTSNATVRVVSCSPTARCLVGEHLCPPSDQAKPRLGSQSAGRPVTRARCCLQGLCTRKPYASDSGNPAKMRWHCKVLEGSSCEEPRHRCRKRPACPFGSSAEQQRHHQSQGQAPGPCHCKEGTRESHCSQSDLLHNQGGWGQKQERTTAAFVSQHTKCDTMLRRYRCLLFLVFQSHSSAQLDPKSNRRHPRSACGLSLGMRSAYKLHRAST